LDNDIEEVQKETGDLACCTWFFMLKSQVREPLANGGWDIADSLNGICDKLVDRHPHIYGDVEANDEETVKANWEQLKVERRQSSRF